MKKRIGILFLIAFVIFSIVYLFYYNKIGNYKDYVEQLKLKQVNNNVDDSDKEKLIKNNDENDVYEFGYYYKVTKGQSLDFIDDLKIKIKNLDQDKVELSVLKSKEVNADLTISLGNEANVYKLNNYIFEFKKELVDEQYILIKINKY